MYFFSNNTKNYTLNGNKSIYSKFINHLCLLLYEALDFGLKSEVERILNPNLEELVNFISMSEEDLQNEQLLTDLQPQTIMDHISKVILWIDVFFNFYRLGGFVN